MSVLITNIGELVTNDAGDRRPAPRPGAFAAIADAALVIDGAGWPGPARRRRRRPRTSASTRRPGGAARLRRLARAPGVRGRAQRRVRGPDGGQPVPGGRHPHHGGGHPRGQRRAAPREPARRWPRRCWPRAPPRSSASRDTGSRWPTRRRSVALAAEVTPEVTFLGAHVVPPEFAGTAPATWTWSAARCSPPARRRPGGWTCSASGARSARTRPARCSPPAAPPGCIPRVHANQLGPGPGVQLAVELGAASADHCTYLTDADVDALAGGGTVATLLPGRRVLHPAARIRTPAACWTPGPPSPWPPTATRGPASPPACRCASPWPCGRCG